MVTAVSLRVSICWLLFAHAEFITAGNKLGIFSSLYCILLTIFLKNWQHWYSPTVESLL